MRALAPALRQYWQRLLGRAPRRLVATTAGKILLALTVACGLLALQSGNNLLFFVWGMQLGAIAISGLLSEAALRPLQLSASLPGHARVGERAIVTLVVENRWRRLPVFALQLTAQVRAAGRPEWVEGPYQLRLSGGAPTSVQASFVPQRRGRLSLAQLVARTGYPFGLFIKDRRFAVPEGHVAIWPERLPAGHLVQALQLAMGDKPMHRAGLGDDFFAVRPFRPGDAPARALWRRAASGRPLLVREFAESRGQRVTLVLQLDASAADEARERTLALAASLVEALAQAGMAVGLLTHGFFLGATAARAHPARHAARLLDALSDLNFSRPLPPLPQPLHLGPAVALVGLAACGAQGPHPQVNIAAPPRASQGAAAATGAAPAR